MQGVRHVRVREVPATRGRASRRHYYYYLLRAQALGCTLDLSCIRWSLTQSCKKLQGPSTCWNIVKSFSKTKALGSTHGRRRKGNSPPKSSIKLQSPQSSNGGALDVGGCTLLEVYPREPLFRRKLKELSVVQSKLPGQTRCVQSKLPGQNRNAEEWKIGSLAVEEWWQSKDCKRSGNDVRCRPRPPRRETDFLAAVSCWCWCQC